MNRLRATSIRKDLIINSNAGVDGTIAFIGEIQLNELNDVLVIRWAKAYPQKGKTLFVKFSYLFIIFCGSFILLLKIVKFLLIKGQLKAEVSDLNIFS